MKPPVNTQGMAVVERGDSGELLLMLPDGDIAACDSAESVERHYKRWAKRHAKADAINVLTIEWRDGTKAPTTDTASTNRR